MFRINQKSSFPLPLACQWWGALNERNTMRCTIPINRETRSQDVDELMEASGLPLPGLTSLQIVTSDRKLTMPDELKQLNQECRKQKFKVSVLVGPCLAIFNLKFSWNWAEARSGIEMLAAVKRYPYHMRQGHKGLPGCCRHIWLAFWCHRLAVDR